MTLMPFPFFTHYLFGFLKKPLQAPLTVSKLGFNNSKAVYFLPNFSNGKLSEEIATFFNVLAEL
ncbi:hypothetical protein [Thermococcus alcaliphilus]|uniref:hypothetical protein n=1 Tax=Thermococcus alcaliphilus TaxID=139207 RepID=UPI0020908EEF|nr:hypothetical protein [Thermococcus alcaliphilus]MCO6041612.1 hypothetical protein [Thermococcus alcaliphilus]